MCQTPFTPRLKTHEATSTQDPDLRILNSLSSPSFGPFTVTPDRMHTPRLRHLRTPELAAPAVLALNRQKLTEAGVSKQKPVKPTDDVIKHGCLEFDEEPYQPPLSKRDVSPLALNAAAQRSHSSESQHGVSYRCTTIRELPNHRASQQSNPQGGTLTTKNRQLRPSDRKSTQETNTTAFQTTTSGSTISRSGTHISVPVTSPLEAQYVLSQPTASHTRENTQRVSSRFENSSNSDCETRSYRSSEFERYDPNTFENTTGALRLQESRQESRALRTQESRQESHVHARGSSPCSKSGHTGMPSRAQTRSTAKESRQESRALRTQEPHQESRVEAHATAMPVPMRESVDTQQTVVSHGGSTSHMSFSCDDSEFASQAFPALGALPSRSDTRSVRSGNLSLEPPIFGDRVYGPPY